MDPVIVYARRLQAGEIPPADIPSYAAPLYVNSEGKLLVSVEGVTINLPGGGVNILDPIGPAGAIQVESVPGSPVQVAFVTAPDVKISQPLGAAGGVKVEPAAITPKTAVTAQAPFMAIRLRPLINRSSIRLSEIQIELTTTDTTLIRVYIGIISLTGAVWTAVDATNSVAEGDVAAIAFTGGVLRYSGFVTQNTRRFSIPRGGIPISPITDMAGNVYPILITTQNLAGAADLHGNIVWNEA